MSAAHIFAADPQPATDWTDAGRQLGYKPDTLLWSACCGRQHPARDCVVYSFYDGPMIFCAPLRGCKDPLMLAAKRAKEFASRSAAQKARFAKNAVAQIAAHAEQSK